MSESFLKWTEGLSTEDQARALEWMFAARNGDEFDQAMLMGLLRGDFRIAFRSDGTPIFSLTEQGRVTAERAILENPRAAEMWRTLHGGAKSRDDH